MGIMESMDEDIGQPWQDHSWKDPVRSRMRKRAILILLTIVVIVLTLPIASYVVYDSMTGIDCTLSVELIVPWSYAMMGEMDDFIIVDALGLIGGRVGSENATVTTSTFTATFQIGRTGTYEVTGGVRTDGGSVFIRETVEITKEDDRGVVEMVLNLGD